LRLLFNMQTYPSIAGMSQMRQVAEMFPFNANCASSGSPMRILVPLRPPPPVPPPPGSAARQYYESLASTRWAALGSFLTGVVTTLDAVRAQPLQLCRALASIARRGRRSSTSRARALTAAELDSHNRA
jgi:hypothetical protein